MVDQVGTGGLGYIWSICEGDQEEEWRHSVAPFSLNKLAERTQAPDDDLKLLNQDGSILPPSGELNPSSNSVDSENDDNEDTTFEKEVIDYNPPDISKFSKDKLYTCALIFRWKQLS